MVAKLKRSSLGGCEFLLVAIDKFSKWIEAKPIKKADGATALKFVTYLVVRFGLAHSIITDNGTNFAQGELKEYCQEEGIRLDLASVSHPQSNGQVERANTLILGDQNTPRGSATSCCRSLGGRVALCFVELAYNPKQVNRVHAILPCVWSRSST